MSTKTTPTHDEIPCFGKELAGVINKFSMENGSDTPDFILADFLITVIHAWDDATKRRDKWYDFKGGLSNAAGNREPVLPPQAPAPWQSAS